MSRRRDGLIDAHLHLQMPGLREQADSIIDETRRAGISLLIVNGTGPEDWPDVAALAERYPEVVPFFGVHPWKVNELVESGIDWETRLMEYLAQFPEAGVGEVGLDKWIRDHDIGRQKEVFRRQLIVAEKNDRPLAVHCLRAWGHLLECLDDFSPGTPFLLHSFGGPAEMVDEFVKRGAYFSLSGYFFRPDKKEKREVFSKIPSGRLLLETDAPDMLPPAGLISKPLEGMDGKEINHPANLLRIYEAWSAESGRSLEELIACCQQNTNAFLGRAID